MAKPSQESFYAKLRKHAGITESTQKETDNNSTLVDVTRTTDGTAYGIVKENHNYYIKKSNVQEGQLDSSDFAYIGGLQNKTEYQYKSLSEAQKQRNMYVSSLNEAFSLRPKNVVSEQKKIEKIENPFDFIKSRVNEGKATNKLGYENNFKSTLKETSEKIEKNKLMNETATQAIRKAMGLVTEDKAISTEDSEVKTGDVLPDKTGKEKPQAPINDSNAKKKAEKAMGKGSFEGKKSDGKSIAVNQQSDKLKEEASPLVTDDSDLIAGQSLANMDNAGKDNPQAPINDGNAKTEADKAVGKSAGGGGSVTNDTEESEESEPFDDKEDAGDETDDIVSEGKALTTDDSEQKKSDEIANSKGKVGTPEAPYNSYNQPNKGHTQKSGTPLAAKAVVKEETDLSTADSEANPKDSIANKATAPSTSAASIITADSEMNPDQTLANDTKTKLPNPVYEGDEVNEDDTIIYADSVEVAPDSLANQDGTNMSYDSGELPAGTSFSMDDNAISKEVAEDDEVAAELDDAANALDDLGIEIDAGQEVEPEIAAEPEAAPVDDMGGEPEVPVPDMGGEAPVDDMGGMPDMGGEAPAPDMGGLPDEAPVDDMGGEAPVDGEEGVGDDLVEKEIEKLIGKVTQKIRNTDLSPDQTQSFMNSIITAFKSDLADVDGSQRKEMADDIIKADVGTDIEGDTEAPVDDMGGEAPAEPEAPVDDMGGEELPEPEPEVPALESENKCGECGTFEQFAESRGYDSFEGSTIAEVANIVSGYANAFNEGMNDGDFDGVAPYMTEEVMTELKEGYGHEGYVTESLKKKDLTEAEGVKWGSFEPMPPTNGDVEVVEGEEINELGWRDVKNAASGVANAGKFVGNKVGDKLGQAQSAVMNKVQQGVDKVKQVGTDVKQSYHKGNANSMINNIQQDASKLGQTIANFNAQAQKAGQQPIPVQSIIMQISNQIKKGGDVNLQNRRFEGEIKEGGEDFPQDLGTDKGDINTLPSTDMETATNAPKKEKGFAPVAHNLGITTGQIGEGKIRKYVKFKIQELTGKRKPSINESKSDSLKKLDALIETQWNAMKNKNLSEIAHVAYKK